MSRTAILSDIHAGLGKNQPDLKELQQKAVRNATAYLADQDIDTLILNGDTTDHLLNTLDETDEDIAREVIRPIVLLMRERRNSLRTTVIAGNTDWVIADRKSHMRSAFFGATGLDHASVSIPAGGLVTTIDGGDVSVVVTHGHTMKPAQWGQEGPMTPDSYARLLEALRNPGDTFLENISAVTGAHRNDYLKAVAVGAFVKPMPAFVRTRVSDTLGGRLTKEYERHFAGMLSMMADASHRKMLGVMGHTHFAGIREYEGKTILNTGTTGAKPNPLQRTSDPKGHVAIVDTGARTFELIQTYNAARPLSKPETVAQGTFENL